MADKRSAWLHVVLVRRVEAGRAADPEVAFAWEQMVTDQGRVRVERLAAETGWSRKRLWSRFRSQIGLTPKRAAQLVRFDHAAHRLAGQYDTGTKPPGRLEHLPMIWSRYRPRVAAMTRAGAPDPPVKGSAPTNSVAPLAGSRSRLTRPSSCQTPRGRVTFA